jgi:threonine dehydratase
VLRDCARLFSHTAGRQVAAYVKGVTPWVKVIGVEGVRNDAMTQSLHSGRRVSLEGAASVASF